MTQRWVDYLNEKGASYSRSAQKPAQRVPAPELARTEVYFGDTGFGIAVIPADRLVDLGEVSDLLGISCIRLASESELAEHFPDCEPGAMPPFGEAFRMPVLVDTAIARNEYIVFNIGTRGDAVRMRFEDYRQMVNPLIGSFASKSGGPLPRSVFY